MATLGNFLPVQNKRRSVFIAADKKHPTTGRFSTYRSAAGQKPSFPGVAVVRNVDSAIHRIVESLSKRRFCQHGRQPEVSCVVIDGE